MLTSTVSDFGRGSALWHSGGMGQKTLHFSAANGFPTGSYHSFLQLFTESYRLIALENRGAWPDQPAPVKGFDWREHANDLVGFLGGYNAGQPAAKPLVGVGHSIGGAMSLFAALKRPEFFSKLILIEPAGLQERFATFLYKASLKLPNNNSLVARALRRRAVWESRQRFLEYLPTKAAYKHFVPQALADYVDAGLFEKPDGTWGLRYQVAWEAHNFKTADSLWQGLAKVQVPTLLLLAENSNLHSKENIISQAGRFSNAVELQIIEGVGHLAPQEDPQQVAALMMDWLKD